jgi:diketogulonate reductase-like aldo/keto reductase
MEHVEAGGARIPTLGLGTWQNTGRSCAETVETALEMGYRHVDTAQMYDNEGDVGAAIAAAEVDREELFLTTKLWRSNLRADDVETSLRESLDALGVEYVDLLLVHWPHPRVPAEETLGAMADLRSAGLVEHLGVSNFTRDQLEAAVAVADAPIVTNQVLYHPYRDRSALLSYCREAGIALTAYSPLARGAVLDDDRLADIGARYEKSPAQVALRWLVQQEGVVAIPKATGRDHLAANLDVFDFELSAAEMDRIASLDGPLRVRIRSRWPALLRRFPV